MSSSIQVRRRSSQLITGTVNFAAPHGLIINYDPADIHNLVPANGTHGFALTRETVTADAFQTSAAMGNHLAIIGGSVTASKIQEAEIEGPDLLLTSGTGFIDNTTAIGTPLSTNKGRISVAQGGEETVGYLRAKLPVEDSANRVRVLVQFI